MLTIIQFAAGYMLGRTIYEILEYVHNAKIMIKDTPEGTTHHDNDECRKCEVCKAHFMKGFITDHTCLTKKQDDLYCPHCSGCGEIGCDGIRHFLNIHVKGKTNCTYEEAFISDIIELYDVGK